MMLEATDTDFAPWYILPSDDKRRARLNCISHLLSLIRYEPIVYEKPEIPDRIMNDEYDDWSSLENRRFVPQEF
jgi:hypothetical protein